MITSYTYRIKWSSTGMSYYGVRYKHGCSASDLMTTYFTSSKYVHRYIEEHGVPDIIQIRQTFSNKLDAKLWEERVINRCKLHTNKLWLNAGNNGSFKGVIMTKEMREKISMTKKQSPSNSVGKKCFNNGKTHIWLTDIDPVPDGFVAGRIRTPDQVVQASIRAKERFANMSHEAKAKKFAEHSIKTKGKPKPAGFGEKISISSSGKPKPHMRGDANPAKTLAARDKISKSHLTREYGKWYTHIQTNVSIYVKKSDVVDLTNYVRGKPSIGKWFNDGITNIWILDSSTEPTSHLTPGKIKIPKMWITNGDKSLQCPIDTSIPPGWYKGRAI